MDVGSLSLKVKTEGMPEAKQGMSDLSNVASILETRSTSLHGVMRSLSGGMLGTTAVISGMTGVVIEAYRHADKMRDAYQGIAHSLATAGTAAQGYAMSLTQELTALKDADTPYSKTVHSLDRMEVLKARLYALGPDYRKMIDDEVSSYGDLLKVIEKINAQHLKRIELQIQDQEIQVKKAMSPGWLAGLGQSMGSMAGAPGGVGQYLAMRGMDSDLQKLNQENEKLNKLFADRAKLMDKAEYKPMRNQIEAAESLYEVNHRIYQLETLRALGPGKSVPDDLLAPALPKLALDFKPIEDSATSMTRRIYEAAAAGNTFAIVSREILESSGYAADSMTRWMNNTDGLGRSWTTLGNTVRNVLADMIRQMEQAIIKQKLLDPLFKAGADWIFKWGNPAPAGGGTSFGSGSGWSTNGGVGAGGFTGKLFAAPGGSSQPTIVNQISVTVTDGKATTTADAGNGGEAIAKNLKGLMNQWAVEQSRSGGMFAAR